MSLSELQQISVCQILDIMPYELTAQLTFMGARLTDAMITDIDDKITAWDGGIGNKFTRLMPKESNKGVMTDPEGERNNIRREIALLLERPEWSRSGSMYLQRS